MSSQPITFRAPWCRSLVVISVVVTLVCFAVCAPLAAVGQKWRPWGALLGILPALLPAGAAPFLIRGYILTDDSLLIRRLFWPTTISLAGLRAVRHDPAAMRWSIRTCGNGGLFSITGFYWNKKLGSYRAFVTDPARSVIIRLAKRTLVVSPENPAEFAARLQERISPPPTTTEAAGSGR